MRYKPPLQVAFFDRNGNISREWALFLEFAHTEDTGQDWTPTWSSLTTVGSVTHTGRIYRLSSSLIYFRATITTSGGGTTASTAGTTYISNFPATAAFNGACVAVNTTTNQAIGSGVINATNSRIYTPAWIATSNGITISGTIEAR